MAPVRFVVTLSPAPNDRWRYADGELSIARGITVQRIFPLPTTGRRTRRPAITAVKMMSGAVRGDMRRAAPRTTPRRRCAALRISAHRWIFINGDSAGFATVDASGTGSLDHDAIGESTLLHRPGQPMRMARAACRTGQDHCRS